MKVSIRNQLKGVVSNIDVGQVMAKITVQVGDQKIVSVITKEAAEDLGLKVGDEVTTLIKSTSVGLAK
ncbi:MAG: hypothetical protein PWP15_157 [Methanothermococcus sp.]|jgi:molybdopterin-binding protein|uniref:TOBE domain-containing protein n=1 Tax=Methanothermococcus TaxID=155862 RepID=UPI00036F1E49|nr:MULTISPECIES: TOBE domain-containing protein [Methanothermococcus]MDK2789650.1 hypothetical protein [Methanothermococcus sp.]MDK2988093.1 hypothetical protein [Methanothermococcus sp.]